MFWKMRRIKAYRFCKNETAKKNLFRQFLRVSQILHFYRYKMGITRFSVDDLYGVFGDFLINVSRRSVGGSQNELALPSMTKSLRFFLSDRSHCYESMILLHHQHTAHRLAFYVATILSAPLELLQLYFFFGVLK